MFTVLQTETLGRRATLHCVHGDVETPVFFPVATAGAMKGITLADLEHLGAEALLSNTYHLHLSPGDDVISEAGGLHAFMGWPKPILTDSGGFQVFSLRSLRSIGDDGVWFRDHRSGKERFIGPIEAMRIQANLGSDIRMCFDECPPARASREEHERAVDRTLAWAQICKKQHSLLLRGTEPSSAEHRKPLLFGIVQGGLHRDLREKCTEELIAMNFDGYAIGGLAVGETEEEMYSVLDDVCPLLPHEKPRYLMGVGERHQIAACTMKGIDMFDCVSPMREARHGSLWLSDGSKLRIRRSEFQHRHEPIDTNSPAPTSLRHSKAYLHHLLRIGERYGETIACLQNMAVMLYSMKKLRQSIVDASAGTTPSFLPK